MPYIQKHLREQAYRVPLNAGELNYAVTRRGIADREEPIHEIQTGIRAIVDAYVTRRGQITYSTINEIVGVLTCAGLEAMRRDADPDLRWMFEQLADEWYMEVAGPYEDLKCAVNGDVYA